MDAFDRVAKVFQEVFDVDLTSFTLQTVPEDVPKWDSMGHMSLVSRLEQEFTTQFDIDEIMEMASVARIVEIIQAKLD